MGSGSKVVGRVKTALVLGQGESRVALISNILARVQPTLKPKRLSVAGPAVFSAEIIQHFEDTVLTTVDRIVHGLGLESKSFELSVVNLGAASVSGIGMDISGYSADVAVMTAMLSAALELPSPQSIIVTGHVASADGDIRPVESLPVKLEAALKDEAILHFICPSPAADGSCRILTPKETQNIEDAVIAAKNMIRISEVTDIFDLVKTMFSDETIVVSGLRSGFFGRKSVSITGNAPTDHAAQYLLSENESRFWRTLENHLLSERCTDARHLLLTRINFQVCRKEYPKGFGRELYQLILSLPPSIRRLKVLFPLVPLDKCLELSRFFLESDLKDVELLIEAALGKIIPKNTDDKKSSPTTRSHGVASASADTVLDLIRSESLAEKIGLPIDAARASYAMGAVVLDSHQDFLDTVSAFYIHLLRHTNSISGSVELRKASDNAYHLLDQAFEGKGGAVAAWAEARHGTNGGLRFVIDVMTEQFKTEQQLKYINSVFKEVVDPLDWDAKEALMAAFLDRMGQHLPDEVRKQPVKRYIRHYEPIVRFYIKSLDQVKDLLRRL